MIKFRIYLDKEAEEKWLNQMAADGWAMESFFGGIYQFSACEKGAYTYRVDFGDKLFSISEDYRELMQDAGIQIVQTWGYWVILRRRHQKEHLCSIQIWLLTLNTIRKFAECLKLSQ